jgi:hypothetical protein
MFQARWGPHNCCHAPHMFQAWRGAQNRSNTPRALHTQRGLSSSCRRRFALKAQAWICGGRLKQVRKGQRAAALAFTA